ncbi:MAG: MATE family efflux transporter [Rhodospirillales bacterium]|jgi:MATE family multidrug resistance protein|nr:MATE family efflux transporter [Rhodospirillales bacterium]MDP6843025.1 MATE family efflux transporter [Rhodospirillales bacterium]
MINCTAEYADPAHSVNKRSAADQINMSVSFPRPSKNDHKQVWHLATPIIVANLSVPMLGAVDTAVIGHLDQSFYLGAVAVGAVIFQFIYWSFGFLRMGTTGLTAQALGSKNYAEVQAIFYRALILGAAIAIAIWLLQLPILWVALALFEASEQVEILGATYFHVRIWSAPAVLANYCLVGWFIGIRNTRAALLLQVWMNGLNILLDLLFVLGFGLDVAGVAAATVISEYCAAGAGLVLFHRHARHMNIDRERPRIIDGAKLKRMLFINLDIFIRTFCLLFAFSFFTAQAAKLNDDILAANAVLIQFQHFLSFGLDGFAHAAEALVGGAIGAGNRARLRAAVITSGYWALAIAVLYTIIYAGAGGLIIELLTGIEDVRALAGEFLVWLIISPIISVWSFMLDGIFIGATRTREMRNGMLISLAIFIAAVFVLKPELGNHGLWLALMLFMVARAVTLGVYYPKLERTVDRD